MDRWINFSQDRINLVKLKTKQTQELFSLKSRLEGMLDYLYDNHHNNIHLKRLDDIRINLKTFLIQDSSEYVGKLQSLIYGLNCELTLIAILFYPDVGEYCYEVISLAHVILRLLDDIRNSYIDIDKCDYILKRMPM